MSVRLRVCLAQVALLLALNINAYPAPIPCCSLFEVLQTTTSTPHHSGKVKYGCIIERIPKIILLDQG